MFNKLCSAIGRRLAAYLGKPMSDYQRLDTVTIGEVADVIKPGDILLVEGNSRISIAIKYLTQSSWSHACLFVGGTETDETSHCLLEADLIGGVRLVPLQHYSDFNVRICRPVGVSEQNINNIIDFAMSKLGHQYDLKNIIDLGRYLIQKPIVPNRYRRALLSFGSGEPTRVICSTLIAQAFQSISYPILPRREHDLENTGVTPRYYRRHFTHFTPRDFDLSPYFAVIKPTLEKNFDYAGLTWLDPDGS